MKKRTIKQLIEVVNWWDVKNKQTDYFPIEYDYELEHKMIDIVQHGDVLHLSELK